MLHITLLNRRSMLRTSVSLLTAGLFLLSGCELIPEDAIKNPGGNDKPRTILQIAASNPDFASLAAAVVVTGLAPTLGDNKAKLTVFAPTNAAFAKLPAPFNNAFSIAGIKDEAQIQALKTILLYHVVAGRKPSSSLKAGAITTQKALDEKVDNAVYVSLNKNAQFSHPVPAAGLYLNGQVKAVKVDIHASNGVIHAIDQVLQFPDKNIVEIAQGNENFTALVAAVVKTDLAGLLAGQGNFTVFAPTNAAFAKLPAPFHSAASISKIHDQKQITALANILKYHVIASARVFSPDLKDGGKATTAADAASNVVTFGVKNKTVTVKGKSNSTSSVINPANLLATNGVVHVIDQVLLP